MFPEENGNLVILLLWMSCVIKNACVWSMSA